MTINKQAFEFVGVTEHEYKQWCNKNHRASYSTKSKKEFFKKIQTKELVRDKTTGELISVVNSDKA